MKRALITGGRGQDGYYMSQILLREGYQLVGDIALSAPYNTYPYAANIKVDVTNGPQLRQIFEDFKPNLIFNFAAQSSVAESWNDSEKTWAVNFEGVEKLLTLIKKYAEKGHVCKMVHASSGEIFGPSFDMDTQDKIYQDENTWAAPKSPYAQSKWLAQNYVESFRETYGLPVCSAILMNHESPRRPKKFLFRKITSYIAALINGYATPRLTLGSLSPIRDFGYAPEYCEAMYLMATADKQSDYVISTGRGVSIKELVDLCFQSVDLNYQDYITVDQNLIRKNDTPILLGCSNKIYRELGWKPKVELEELINLMIKEDLRCLS